MKQITNGCFDFIATTPNYFWTYDLVDDLKQVAVFWSVLLLQSVKTVKGRIYFSSNKLYYFVDEDITQPANIDSQDVSRTSPSNVPRTLPKDSIWSSRERPNLTSWENPDMKSLGRPYLTFKRRAWQDYWERSQDVCSTSPIGPSKHVLGTMLGHQLDVPK